MPDQYIGIDIGGTSTTIGIVQDGTVTDRARISMLDRTDPARLVQDIVEIVEAFDIDPNGIGIGAPNGNTLTGCIDHAPNLLFEGEVPLAAMLEDRLGVSCYLTNDANAAAYGEREFGAAKGLQDFIMITLGTGLGSGIFSNGQIVIGHTGMAGEIGHSIVQHGGRKCSCGRNGCLETYVSIRGIQRTLRKIANQRDDLEWMQRKEIDPESISKAAMGGDSTALETFDRTAMILALGLSNSVAHYSPEAIFFFGGIAEAGNILLTPFRKYFEDYLLFNFKNTVRISRSGLPMNDAAILGAAALIRSKTI